MPQTICVIAGHLALVSATEKEKGELLKSTQSTGSIHPSRSEVSDTTDKDGHLKPGRIPEEEYTVSAAIGIYNK